MALSAVHPLFTGRVSRSSGEADGAVAQVVPRVAGVTKRSRSASRTLLRRPACCDQPQGQRPKHRAANHFRLQLRPGPGSKVQTAATLTLPAGGCQTTALVSNPGKPPSKCICMPLSARPDQAATVVNRSVARCRASFSACGARGDRLSGGAIRSRVRGGYEFHTGAVRRPFEPMTSLATPAA